ncbi:hypothetical protein [Haloechinothrix salitolerans]|uniref:Esterase-like activity of phytase family protein n=1 Tax=Haloechinothrix salitolerans TaxID=926830 RepID=A0ABW2C498_9PSEU
MGRSRRHRAVRAAATALVAMGPLLSLMALPGAALAAGQPKTLCTIRDQRLTELSGLAADESWWYGVPDGGSSLKVYVLDRSCAVRKVITGGIDPYDVEDLALATDGTLWLADTGDNRSKRDTVAVHTLRPDGTARMYRLTYPDGKHDAEALLLGPSGVPHIVTKNVLGSAGVYRPDRTLRSPGPTPLTKVAEVAIPGSDTPGGPVGTVSSALITGGAVSRDGTLVALRTYTDAYLYPAPRGHLVEALSREPVRIPLPNEPQGEAIALTPDGTMLSAGEGASQPLRAVRDVAGVVARAERDARSEPAATVDSESPEEIDRVAGLKPLPAAAAALMITGVVWFGVRLVRKLRDRMGR